MCMSGDGAGVKNIIFEREEESVYILQFHVNLEEVDAFFELGFLL